MINNFKSQNKSIENFTEVVPDGEYVIRVDGQSQGYTLGDFYARINPDNKFVFLIPITNQALQTRNPPTVRITNNEDNTISLRGENDKYCTYAGGRGGLNCNTDKPNGPQSWEKFDIEPVEGKNNTFKLKTKKNNTNKYCVKHSNSSFFDCVSDTNNEETATEFIIELASEFRIEQEPTTPAPTTLAQGESARTNPAPTTPAPTTPAPTTPAPTVNAATAIFYVYGEEWTPILNGTYRRSFYTTDMGNSEQNKGTYVYIKEGGIGEGVIAYRASDLGEWYFCRGNNGKFHGRCERNDRLASKSGSQNNPTAGRVMLKDWPIRGNQHLTYDSAVVGRFNTRATEPRPTARREPPAGDGRGSVFDRER